MQEHYVTAITEVQAGYVIGGCRCGKVISVPAYNFGGEVTKHIREAKEAEKEAAARAEEALTEPMPRRIEMADVRALAESLAADMDKVFGKPVEK